MSMSRRVSPLLALGLSAAFSLPAAAQAPAASAAPVLRVEAGTVMTSSGGEFASALGGELLQPGDRVMLAEAGRAVLVYPNGCTKPLEEAGVYTVTESCVPVAVASAGGSSRLIVGGVAALGVIAAVAGGGGGGGSENPPAPPPPPPVSR